MLGYCIDSFVRRHGISRDGKSVALNSMMLRRTYATHQLYKGRSLEWVRAQLGHKKIENTKSYVQFDVYEHPVQVGPPLDDWGRRTLNLWHCPVVVESLTPPARQAIFMNQRSGCGGEELEGAGQVGRPSENVLPPCSTCERLVTGEEYWDNWEREREQREDRLRILEADPARANLLEREKGEYSLFMENYARVRRSGSR